MDFLTLFISLRCTNTCAHCIYGCSPKKGEHMSWDVFAKSVAIAEKSGIPTLNFFGGEPLLNPDIFQMMEMSFKRGFSVMLATNCRPLRIEAVFNKFKSVTEQYRERIVIYTARDKFHLKFFDPGEIVIGLLSEGYRVSVENRSNQEVALSEYNFNNQELRDLKTHWSCCGTRWTDYLGVLPDGGWTICPPSLEAFGNIFSNSLEEIVEFKRGLPLHFEEGCTECLKDFKNFGRTLKEGDPFKKQESQRQEEHLESSTVHRHNSAISLE